METPQEGGKGALEALLYLHGDAARQLETLVKLLVLKGVVTDDEWDSALAEAFTEERADLSRIAQSNLDPDDKAALEGFFGR